MLSLFVYKNYKQIAHKFVELIHSEFTDIKPNINIAISGGETFRNIFEKIIEENIELDMQRINIYWTDERCVPSTNDQSNFGIFQACYLSKIEYDAAKIFKIDGSVDPEAESENYANILQNNLPVKDGLPIFDLIFLGVGEDGHIASIFPNQIHLLNDDKICDVSIHPANGQKRITITGKVIRNAKKIIVIATGTRKKEIVSKAINKELYNEIDIPALDLHPGPSPVIWMMDKEAGELIW